MSAHDKLLSMESWKTSDVKIMVCTSAFGMGIDQSDVEVVMRIGCPPTLEAIVQEFGRGGRDGRHAKGMVTIYNAHNNYAWIYICYRYFVLP
jgi:ATP-dependent DNA helicase RecQ